VCRIPKGYRFLQLDGRARFVNDTEDIQPSIHKRILGWFTEVFQPQQTIRSAIACNYNMAKIVVAVGQLAFSLVTLYRTRGDQIGMYGYAAFGLTVAQYAWMSLFNLIGSLVCPNYPSIFIVKSQTLEALRTKIGDAGKTHLYPLSSTVGELERESELAIIKDYNNIKVKGFVMAVGRTVLGIFIAAVPIAIIGGLSGFAPGNSALYQRVWTMIWLVYGAGTGCFSSALAELLFDLAARKRRGWVVLLVVLYVIVFSCAPAIGGFAVVGEMIINYGECIRLQDVSV